MITSSRRLIALILALAAAMIDGPNPPAVAGTLEAEAPIARELWTATSAGPRPAPDGPFDLGVDPTGTRVVVTGYSNKDPQGEDFMTIAYDASSGAELWSRRYHGNVAYSSDFSVGLAFSPDSATVYVTGSSRDIENEWDIATVAYDLESGATKWVSRFDGPVHDIDAAAGIAVSSDGSVYVGGTSWSGTSYDFVTIKYDPLGHVVWTRFYDDPAKSRNALRDIRVSKDGSVYVSGGSRKPLQFDTDDVAVVAYGSEGTERWVAKYDSPDSLPDVATDLTVSPDGSRIFVTGYSKFLSSNYGALNIALDANSGNPVWVFRNQYPDESRFAQTAGVSPDGDTLFAAGFLISYDPEEDTSEGFSLAAAYATADGSQIWRRQIGTASVPRPDTPDGVWVPGGDYLILASQDSSYDLVVSPDGSRIYLTGSTDSRVTTLGATRDVATVALNADDGSTVWHTTYDSPYRPLKQSGRLDFGWYIAISPEGSRLFVAGDTSREESSLDFLTIAYCTAVMRSGECGGQFSGAASGDRVAGVTTRVRNDAGDDRVASLIAYRTSGGAVHTQVSICSVNTLETGWADVGLPPSSCEHFSGEDPYGRLEPSKSQGDAILDLLAYVPGLGAIDASIVTLGKTLGKQSCSDTQAGSNFSAQAVEVYEGVMAEGTFLGPWQESGGGCAIWAKDGALEWSLP